jgi:hypothetical protein
VAIYFLKSSRFRQYQQENLALLRAAADERAVVRYNAHWLEPRLRQRDLRGLEALVVLGDKPYERFAPIRFGFIERVTDEGERVEFQILLGARPATDLDFGSFDQWFAGRIRIEERPRFVLEDSWLDGLAAAEMGDETHMVGSWRVSVERLLAADPGDHYENSAFLLNLDLRDEKSGRRVLPNQLETGHSYSQRFYAYNPHLDDDQIARLRYEVDYDRTEIELLEELPALGSDISQEMRFRVLVPGTARMEIDVLPFAERSNRLPLHYHATGEVSATVPGGSASVSKSNARGLHHLLDWLDRCDALNDPETARGTLERMLLMVPDDRRIKRRLGHLHHQNGHHREAVELFEMLGDDNLASADWLPYFMSACATYCEAGRLAELLEHLPWSDLEEYQADQLGRAVAALDEGSILRLLESLAYFGTDQFLEVIWKPIRPAIRTPAGIGQAYRILQETHLESHAGAYQYLQQRTAAEGVCDAELDERMLSHGAELDDEPPGYRRVLDRHFRRLVADRRWADAEVQLHLSRGCLSPAAFAEVRLDLVELLRAAEEPAADRIAARLLAAAADRARRDGELDEATEYLEGALQLAAREPEVIRVREAVQKAMEDCEEIRALRAEKLDVRVKTLRHRLAGKRLIVVGAPNSKPWAEELRRELALDEVRWFQTSVGKPARPEELRGAVGRATGAVVVLAAYIGHKSSDAVREQSAKQGIPCAVVPRGTSKDAVLRQLMQELGV